MTNEIDYLVMVSSWEERSVSGCKQILEDKKINNAIIFNYKEYLKETEDNRNQLLTLLSQKGVEVIEVELSFYDSVDTWKKIYTIINKTDVAGKHVLIDISTMPRDAIWTVVDQMKFHKSEVSFAYHKPEKYNQEWLSRDHKKAQIVYKMGGLTMMGKSTNLLVISGYDIERIVQIIDCYEPQKVMIGVQVGEQFNNQAENANKVIKKFSNFQDIELFDIDAYKSDYGFNAIESAIKPYIEDSNMILSSLGPKLSAIALYKIHEKYNNTSLAYIPSGQYNTAYSNGYTDTTYFEL